MNIENIKAVYREPLKRGFRFVDQDGQVLRKQATRAYTHCAINHWPGGLQFLSFHQTANPTKTHSTCVIDRVIAIEERRAESPAPADQDNTLEELRGEMRRAKEEHLVAADSHLGAAMRLTKSKLSREDIRDAQFKIDDSLTHEQNAHQSKERELI